MYSTKKKEINLKYIIWSAQLYVLCVQLLQNLDSDFGGQISPEIKWNANLMRQCIYWSFLSSIYLGPTRTSSEALDVKVAAYGFLHPVWRWVVAPSKLYTRPTQRLSGPPPIYKLGAENHMLQL